VIHLERSGQPTVRLSSEHCAALEVLVREKDHPVAMVP
jgi:hypothetical protein